MNGSKSKEFKKLFIGALDRLKKEVEAYENDDFLWVKKRQINNSAGNLTLHICGNLKHFIGNVLYGSSYVRDRTFEFEGKTSRKKLIENIDETTNVIVRYFDSVTNEKYEETYPIEVLGHPMTIFYFIVHLQGHLNYHLGQVNYHRRLIMTV